LKLFDLRHDKKHLWSDAQALPVPQYLEDAIARICAITHSGARRANEAFCRTIIDQILICSIFEEGNKSSRQAKQAQNTTVSQPSHAHPTTSHLSKELPPSIEEDPAMLELQHETLISRPVIHNGETKLLSGFADYSVWYDSAKKNTLATNLLIIEAKRRFVTDFALPQLASYMGAVHARRKEEQKQDSVIYGAASDGFTFRFCRIDGDGVWTMSRLLEWESGDAGKIYSIFQALIRAAALSSPSNIPIKDPKLRDVVLASFGSPQLTRKFDYGLNQLQILEEDDETDIIG
jgi:hypothetical protein